MFFNREGVPIGREEWCRLSGDTTYKRVALTKVGDVDVSTVWLGLDHSFGGPSPLIFETMTFPGEYQERYSTEKAALEGHAEMVKRLQGAE